MNENVPEEFITSLALDLAGAEESDAEASERRDENCSFLPQRHAKIAVDAPSDLALDAAATEELLTTKSADIEYIRNGAEHIAVILRRHYVRDGIAFLTPNDYSQQLGYMNRPAGYKIPPHVHNPVPREVVFTKEVLLVKSGKARVDFYDDDRNYLESRYLNAGDVILLASGGHGFEMLEATEMIEVKQGPYVGDEDKARFEAVASDQIRIR